MSNYNETNVLAHFHDPKEDEMPSIKFGPEVFLGIFCLFIVFSGLLACFILYCSRMQEKLKSKDRKASAEKTHEDLKANLTLKPWCPADETARTMTEVSMSLNSNSITDSEPEASQTSASDNIVFDVEMQMPERNPCCSQKDGSTCALCSEEYQPGQPVYESNNPHCGHQFHKVCMDKWLRFQNTCPVCNQPFVLQTV